MENVLVTGGTGFIGRQLLSTPRKWHARVALRRPLVEVFGESAKVVVGEIGPDTDWDTALRDVDCVVHMAARVHVMQPTVSDDELFLSVNERGTAHLALAAAKLGVKRFIFLSSIKVNGEATSGKPYSPNDIPAPMDQYGRSKWAAEQKLFEIGEKYGMEVIVIRPPLVYGPGVGANFLKLLSWTYRQLPLPLGGVHNARSIVSVWNLCDLIEKVIAARSVSSGVLMVSDGFDLSTAEIIRRLAHAMGKSPRLVYVPIPLLKLAGAVVGRSAEVSRLCGSLVVDISQTKRQLGWSPPVTIDDGLARTAQWYVSEFAKQRA